MEGIHFCVREVGGMKIEVIYLCMKKSQELTVLKMYYDYEGYVLVLMVTSFMY